MAGTTASSSQVTAIQDAVEDAPTKLVSAWLDNLIERLSELERIGKTEPISSGCVADVVEVYRRFCCQLNQLIGPGSTLADQQCAHLGQLVKARFSHYVDVAASASRWRSKPRGYAGDDISIQQIYDRRPCGECDFIRAIDSLFLEMPSAQAVRNRRHILASRVKETYRGARGQRVVHVTALAAGPASEMFDAWEDLGRPADLHVCLVDGDPFAIKALEQRSADTGAAASTKLCSTIHKANLAHVALGRAKLDVPMQDLIYSLGVADYLKDDMVVNLLDAAYRLLRPGGLVILGNFHKANPDKACLDHIIEWKLIHRSESDMHRLMEKSLFATPCEEIVREPTGVQMLAVGRKPLTSSL